MKAVPNGHDPEWTRSQMDTISNGRISNGPSFK